MAYCTLIISTSLFSSIAVNLANFRNLDMFTVRNRCLKFFFPAGFKSFIDLTSKHWYNRLLFLPLFPNYWRKLFVETYPGMLAGHHCHCRPSQCNINYGIAKIGTRDTMRGSMPKFHYKPIVIGSLTHLTIDITFARICRINVALEHQSLIKN